jgi:DeoR/GlpR family transcriptional regulator of sugar metabolism
MSEQVSPALTVERRAAIAKMVAQEGAARVADLVDQLDVHASTIRRDLKALEAQGVIRRVHGGAVAVEEATPVDHSDGAPSGSQEARIGQAVAEMVADGQTVFLGPGKLPLEVARRLAEHSRLTIVTNGLEIAKWVAVNTSHTLIVTGGQAEERDLRLVGQLARTALSNLRADHAVLELGGISAVGGLTEDSLSQAEISRLLLELGTQVIVIVPAERVGRVAAAYIAPAADADVMVTGREAPSAFLWDLSQSGIRVVLA